MNISGLLPDRVVSSIGMTFDQRVNCFCISEHFYRTTAFRQTPADEMLNFTTDYFLQTKDFSPNVLTLVWSRTSPQLPIGEIDVQLLSKRLSGFPFGLVLEHSFVQLDSELVFQKADPRTSSKIELLPVAQAVEHYRKLKGFETTRHLPLAPF